MCPGVGVGVGVSPNLKKRKGLSFGERAMALIGGVKLLGLALYNGMVATGGRIIGFVNNTKI